MQFDTKSPVPKLTFRPTRPLEQEDYEAVRELGERPAALAAIRLTVAQTDKVKALPKPKAKAVEVEAEDEPTVRKEEKKPSAVPGKKSLADVVGAWDDED
jgi:hypothetical protein